LTFYKKCAKFENVENSKKEAKMVIKISRVFKKDVKMCAKRLKNCAKILKCYKKKV
jgi:hypothetical protein